MAGGDKLEMAPRLAHCVKNFGAYNGVLDVDKKQNLITALHIHMSQGVDDIVRHLTLGYIFGTGERIEQLSLTALKDWQIMALMQWLGSQKVNGEWLIHGDFTREYKALRMLTMAIFKLQSPESMVEEAIKLGGKLTKKTPEPVQDTFMFED